MSEPRSLSYLVLTTYLIVSGCSPAKDNGNIGPVTARLDALADEVRTGRVATIEVAQIRLSKEFFVAVLPDTLDTVWDYKFTIRTIDDSHRKRISELLKAAPVEVSTTPGDLRWGIVFYSADQKRLGSLYFDTFGRRGTIDNTPVSFRVDFLFRLRHALDLSFSTIPLPG